MPTMYDDWSLNTSIFIGKARKIVREITYGLSIFVRSRTAFLLLMGCAALLKLLLNTFAPVSFFLRDVALGPGVTSSVSPLVMINAQIYRLWQSVTSSNATGANWWAAPPATFSGSLLALSLALRLPSFIFDAAIAATIYFVIVNRASPREARLASLLWFLNPYMIMVVELLNVPDVAAVFVTVVAVLFLYRKRIFLTSLLITIGIAIGLYPMLILPPILIYCRKKLRITGICQALLAILPLLAGVGYVTFYQTISPLDALLNYIVGSEVSPAALAIVITCFAVWRFNRTLEITDSILPVLLVYYTFSNPPPQYYLWALPFLIIDIVLVERRHLVLLMVLLAFVLGSWFISSGCFLTSSGYSLLFIPLEGSKLPWYSQAIRSFLDSGATDLLMKPLVNAGLAATTFIYALEIIRCWFRVKPKDSRPFHKL